MRTIFIPPDVEDEHPPLKIKANKSIVANVGQMLKSAVQYPVVVMSAATWKKDTLKPSFNPETVPIIVR